MRKGIRSFLLFYKLRMRRIVGFMVSSGLEGRRFERGVGRLLEGIDIGGCIVGGKVRIIIYVG